MRTAEKPRQTPQLENIALTRPVLLLPAPLALSFGATSVPSRHLRRLEAGRVGVAAKRRGCHTLRVLLRSTRRIWEVELESVQGRSAGKPTGTIHSVQLLRAIAAGLVALFHAHQGFATRVARPWFESEGYWFGFGAVGVHVFFVISGFIMVVTSWNRGSYDAAGFFRRRLTRIYPIYWLCALNYLAVHLAIGQPYGLSLAEIGAALTLWPGAASGIIGPAWTLTFELYFYLCFGLAMMLGLTRGLLLLGTIFFAAIVVGVWFRPSSEVANVMTNGLLLEFLAGATIGWLALRGRLPQRFGPLLTVLALALFVAGLAVGYERGPSALVWGIPSAVLVLGLVSWERRVGAGPAIRLVGKLGDSSYVLYLIHILLVTLGIEIALALGGATTLEPMIAAILIAACSVVIAHIVHLAIERPMQHWLSPRRSSGRHRQNTPPSLASEI